jgi:hypothetical protein
MLREQLQRATGLLESTMEGVTSEQAHWLPSGRANSIAANYAHVVVGQDGVVNGRLKGGAPLFASTWSGRVGLSEMPPGPDAQKPGFPDWSGWARRVKVDLPAFRGYAQAVYAASDTYLASLGDEDLGQSIDLGALGLGKMTLAQILIAGVLGNCLTHCGEISCLKGLQGLKGYPM